MKKILLGAFMLFCFQFQAQNLESEAKAKIKTLEKLIKKADKKGIDVLKEKTTIRTAEVFLEFANWDDQNIEANKKAFELVPIYKKNAVKLAQDLPDFERADVVKMLDKAIEEITLVSQGKIKRTPSPKVNWEQVEVEGDQLTYKNRPVFLADYTWKPETKELTEYHGNQDGFFITPSYVVKEDGTINSRKLEELKSKPNGSLGFIFMNHKSVPKWAEEKFGPGLKMREDTYTAYDIDNPGARDVQEKLIGGMVPYMAGKKFSELGYMMCNEPHFFTQTDKTKNKKPWASGGVSEYTIEKFRVWLAEKHKTIAELNTVWKTNFKSFKTVEIQVPIDISLKGTPRWYDWAFFNMERVTEWYTFIKNTTQKYDANAKVHIKIMPNLWTDNQRIHGIDLEALTDLSGIIGNDSGAAHSKLWGKDLEWEKDYKFEWRELCMGFDFMKSVSPNKINFNSELHYLSTVRSRDLYLDPAYARASFWLAHTYGMTASQIWYWPREANGAISKKAQNDKGYAGSNNQQPRVTNEVAMTMIDLNSFSEEIMAMQRQRKSLRLFYSKTSAINKAKHMDDVFELYEDLEFNGTSIGFVTKNIINKQENTNWDVVLVANTQFVTQEELDAVQSYLNKGGTVFIDKVSFKKNEYGQPLKSTLKASKGTLILVNSLEEMEHQAMELLVQKNLLSPVKVKEQNTTGQKGCLWKVIENKEGKHILSIVNVGKSNANLEISLKGAKKGTVCKDLLKGINVTNTPILKPNEVFFVEVVDASK
ncbi:alpha-amylase family protein [Wenyingzhuangia aestuarii]|uniref:alpha-amylase family protein n=1 Tax=Wenyingzhuangia aestuarii TaxID=1647582 RepID=UPI00143B4E2C|nr:beta-galactosidase [Wenyingzhuangia aestuarii]NJB83556.1 beta-galactosidase [Wenyingzhuangia aestuarii]